MNENLLGAISENMGSFSKSQKRIAQFILKSYDKAAFMTASKLGEAVGVSESTVVRFATELGFDGYPQLQKNLSELIRNKLTTVQRIEVASEQIGSEGVLDKVLSSDIDKIRKTLESTLRESFENAVNDIAKAKTIYIIGDRSASALARFLQFYFNLIFDNVKLVHTTSLSEMYEQILRIGKDDVLIGISFPRYSKLTAKAFKFAADMGGKIVAITDSTRSPLAKDATHLLLARSDVTSFVDSLVAPLSLINALIIAVGDKKKTEISKTFDNLEGIWEQYDVFEKN